MASITIVSGDGTRSVGTVTIAAVAPGLFVLNSAGLVAADVITVDTAGAQVFGNTYQVVNGLLFRCLSILGRRHSRFSWCSSEPEYRAVALSQT